MFKPDQLPHDGVYSVDSHRLLLQGPAQEMALIALSLPKVGAKVVLGDRPVRVTLARTWAALSRWNKIRFIWALLTTGFCVSDDLKAEVEAMKARIPLTPQAQGRPHQMDGLLCLPGLPGFWH